MYFWNNYTTNLKHLPTGLKIALKEVFKNNYFFAKSIDKTKILCYTEYVI
jgi:hypothetical protein